MSSFPDFVNLDEADLTLVGSVNLLLASIAYEEFALANLINAEAEKIQYILGTLEGQSPTLPPATIQEILQVNTSADKTLRDIIKKEILLQLKLESLLDVRSDSSLTAAASPASSPAANTTADTASDTSTTADTDAAPAAEEPINSENSK